MDQKNAVDPARLGLKPIWFSAGVCAVYFSLMWLCVFAKPFLGLFVAPGLTIGTALTVGSILIGIAMTWIFVSQVNAAD